MSAPFYRPLLVLVAWLAAGAALAVAATHHQSAGAGSINPGAFRSAIVIDAASGQVLSRTGPTSRARRPASPS